ncbi:MAG: hypothetical protein LCH91_12325 [Bacteroidetes bacterium]|nr:hypothetical protein [Bacteroidota bacterium]
MKTIDIIIQHKELFTPTNITFRTAFSVNLIDVSRFEYDRRLIEVFKELVVNYKELDELTVNEHKSKSYEFEADQSLYLTLKGKLNAETPILLIPFKITFSKEDTESLFKRIELEAIEKFRDNHQMKGLVITTPIKFRVQEITNPNNDWHFYPPSSFKNFKFEQFLSLKYRFTFEMYPENS